MSVQTGEGSGSVLQNNLYLNHSVSSRKPLTAAMLSAITAVPQTKWRYTLDCIIRGWSDERNLPCCHPSSVTPIFHNIHEEGDRSNQKAAHWSRWNTNIKSIITNSYVILECTKSKEKWKASMPNHKKWMSENEMKLFCTEAFSYFHHIQTTDWQENMRNKDLP